MELSQKIQEDWKAHVLAEYPKEAVAYVINDELFTVPNAADDPYRTFAISALEQFEARKVGEIQALLHSHPYKIEDSASFSYDPRWPGTADMKAWLADTIPWGIVSTDGEGLSQMVWMDDKNPEPLIGREFIHGINDCYSVVRDWFRLERGIVLMNFARGMDWWYLPDGEEGCNLYEDNFEKAGFKEVRLEDADIGDVVLMNFFNDKISHAAVIVKQDVILHHIMNRTGSRLSGEDSLPKWHRQIKKVVRYQGPQPDQQYNNHSNSD